MISGSTYQPKPIKHGAKDSCTCPHCWTVFPFEDALYVSRHPDLLGDPMLGPTAATRFRATRFNAEGQAFDPGGYVCHEMACPNCHLEVPRAIAEFPSLFLSIVGTPSSGKSFFLTSTMCQLRRILSSKFAMALTDLETSFNAVLHEYEDALFFPRDPSIFTSLPKTEQQGDTYNRVLFGGTEVMLPKPFLFTLQPQSQHPEAAKADLFSRNIILYDNAGEHFNPNQDTVREPGTLHMSRSEAIFFIFDPTQDTHFRAALTGHPDPQCEKGSRVQRQDIIFNEAARRIRRHVGIPHGRRHQKLVVIIVGKFDIWKKLLPLEVQPEPLIEDRSGLVHGLEIGHIEDVSLALRALLRKMTPELVTAVEEFAERVVYVPVSALGCSPTRNAETGALEVRPADIEPFWTSIPFLYAFARSGLIYRGIKKLAGPAAELTLVSASGHVLMCRDSRGTLLDIPERYAGRIVHHPESGELVRVPDRPASHPPETP